VSCGVTAKIFFAWGQCLVLILDAWGLEVFEAGPKEGVAGGAGGQGRRHFGQMAAALELQYLLLLLLFLLRAVCGVGDQMRSQDLLHA